MDDNRQAKTSRRLKNRFEKLSDTEVTEMYENVRSENFHPDEEFKRFRLENEMTDEEFLFALMAEVDERYFHRVTVPMTV